MTAQEHQAKAPNNRRHAKWLEECERKASRDLDTEPGQTEARQRDAQHDQEPSSRDDFVLSRRVCDRQQSEQRITAPGEPLGHPPEMRQHMLRALKLHAKTAVFLGGGSVH